MDHRPYEEWLLNDQFLTPDQDRDLRLHLRGCHACSSLANANLELRSAAVLAPQQGFNLRFQLRLVALHKLQRRRTWLGMVFLAVFGLAGLVWLLSPYLVYLALPPGRLAGWWIGNLVYLALALRTLGTLAGIIMGVLSGLVPGYVWLISLVLLGGIGFLWTTSVRRVGNILQSAVLAERS